jgi:hypothetical protein
VRCTCIDKISTTGDDAALWPAQQFVSTEGDKVSSVCKGLASGWFANNP